VEAGRRLRQAREAAGLSLRDLALDTLVSTPVLEALERGWRDRLPEGAYLRTMVPLLERRLQLGEGSLQAALPSPDADGASVEGRRALLRRFTPGSIDVFRSWQGTVLYGALTLGLIYAVNLQQERLAAANLLTRAPIPPLAIPQTDRPSVDGNTLLLQSYPDLRPLSASGQPFRLDTLDSDEPRLVFGQLLLKLPTPSRVVITAEDGRQLTELQGAKGTLQLTLPTPLTVAIDPAPAAGAVTWNDAAVEADPKTPGQFRIVPRP
jgi:transcriptional regulator with XRE-family HTH domain